MKQLRAQLANDAAKRSGWEALFPDGAIIAALHWNEVSSDETTKSCQRFSWRGSSIFCCYSPECPVHGQRLETVRRNWRLGICRLHERQTWQ